MKRPQAPKAARITPGARKRSAGSPGAKPDRGDRKHTGSPGADALATYRGKRDFRHSPEPAGAQQRAGKTGSPLRFCVQKHLASHLHYDFRLEHRGVLLSWAVPKGPATDPAVKRLAMQVEDHPVDYGDFEGVIPSGYGAGIVMLWDRGAWAPDEPDVDAALARGELKFTLAGEKLGGSWVLVRFARAGARQWMLIKHRDHYAGTRDITLAKPDSVKTGRDFADILAAAGPDPFPDGPPVKGGETGELFAAIITAAKKKRKPQPAAQH
jgi:bifunctional non-homologous end joining protein LigD